MIKYPKNILSQIKKHLEEEKQRVSVQIKELSVQDPFSNVDRLTDNAASDTEASEEFNHDRYEAMLKELKDKHQSIEAALQRIRNSTYGLCIKCKELIDTDRLAAVPTAELCINCESKKKS